MPESIVDALTSGGAGRLRGACRRWPRSGGRVDGLRLLSGVALTAVFVFTTMHPVSRGTAMKDKRRVARCLARHFRS